MLTTHAPAEAKHKPEEPGDDNDRVQQKTEPGGHFFQEEDIEQQRGLNHERKPHKPLCRPEKHHKGKEKIDGKQLVCQLHGLVVVIDFTAVLRDILPEKFK